MGLSVRRTVARLLRGEGKYERRAKLEREGH